MLDAADNGPSLPDANQWTLLERTIGLMLPIKKVTKHISDEGSSAGDVIPLVIST